uniref:Polymerase/histidinol phosphatase N-terminal domain-containing protein n=1 Tax=Ananas comosus var. bracteatus TaxID=296719 RepID=A0A6V7P7U5_ANACO|nr:unnamed protein product [Ananas comosus var. bracteatus]
MKCIMRRLNVSLNSESQMMNGRGRGRSGKSGDREALLLRASPRRASERHGRRRSRRRPREQPRGGDEEEEAAEAEAEAEEAEHRGGDPRRAVRAPLGVSRRSERRRRGGEGEGEGIASPLRRERRVVFELHAHSTCSDGFLSPSALVERAHRSGVFVVKMNRNRMTVCSEQVKVLALTDHDTMAGVAEAMEAARKFDIRIIPGVEISAVCSPREEAEAAEPVHILAYYGSWGPAKFEELEELLANIRNGRYLRAKEMLLKLSKLKMPLKFEQISNIAGIGVAPGRLHVARAMVEAGYVENLKQAFSRYLYDGDLLMLQAVVQLVSRTGGVAALAHPWALKNPEAAIKNLKAAGLHGIEVYRSDGKLSAFSDLADAYDLVKIGGSDYHGRRGNEEPDLGSVDLPVLAVFEFLKLGRPIWCNALKEILSTFPEEPSCTDMEKNFGFGSQLDLEVFSSMSCAKDSLDLCRSLWPTIEEKEASELEVIKMKLS